jgi:Rad3-related DNA helicase
MMRAATDTADLILMPYNYLMDAESRKPYEMRWKDSIIIFDEAHNLEGVAAESLSVEITSTLLAGCISEADRSAKKLEMHGGSASQPASQSSTRRLFNQPVAQASTCVEKMCTRVLWLSVQCP